jgi:phosphoribosylanthranilate isomerase
LILVDSPNPGSGVAYDYELVNQMPSTVRVLLAGGLTDESVGMAIAQVAPWGVDVASGVEKSHGYKDPIKLKKFIENARAAFEDLDRIAESELRNGNDRPFNWEN